MAKNTHAQEVSTGTPDSYTDAEMADPKPPLVIRRAELGEVDKPSVGGSSTASSEKESTRDEHSTRDDHERAHGTENPSPSELQAADSDVDTADGSTRKTDTASGKKPAKKTTTRKGAKSEDDEFSF